MSENEPHVPDGQKPITLWETDNKCLLVQSRLLEGIVVKLKGDRGKFFEFLNFLLVYRKAIEWLEYDLIEKRSTYKHLYKGFNEIIRQKEYKLDDLMYGGKRRRGITRLFCYFSPAHIHPLEFHLDIGGYLAREEVDQYARFFSFFESILVEIGDCYPESEDQIDFLVYRLFPKIKKELEENPLHSSPDILTRRERMTLHTMNIGFVFDWIIEKLVETKMHTWAFLNNDQLIKNLLYYKPTDKDKGQE